MIEKNEKLEKDLEFFKKNSSYSVKKVKAPYKVLANDSDGYIPSVSYIEGDRKSKGTSSDFRNAGNATMNKRSFITPGKHKKNSVSITFM